MKETISIPLDEAEAHLLRDCDEADLAENLVEILQSYRRDWEGLLVHFTNRDDGRYSRDAETADIEEVETHGWKGSFSGEFQQTFYAGCRDQNGTDDVEFDLDFEVFLDRMVIEVSTEIYEPQRDTFEEY